MIPSALIALTLAAHASDLGNEPSEIINGVDAQKSDWPSALGMVVGAEVELPDYGFTANETMLMCTATLIAPDVVLTAAHCVDLENYLNLSGYGSFMEVSKIGYGFSQKPQLGDYALDFRETGWPDDIDADGDGTPEIAYGKRAVMHPDFSLLTMQMGLAENADIALVFLDAPVDLPYAYLPTREEAEQIATGMDVSIVGWGQATTDPGSSGMKIMADTVIGEISPFEIQIGPAKSDGRKCHGDSGGPTFMDVDSDSLVATRVIGVTSHSYDLTDCEETGGVDTRVDFYLDWIDAEMRAGCADGTRSWCEVEGIIPPPPDPLALAVAELADMSAEESKGGCSTTGSGLAGSGFAIGVALLVRRRRAC